MHCLFNWLSRQCTVPDRHSQLETQPTSVYARRASIRASADDQTWFNLRKPLDEHMPWSVVPKPGPDPLHLPGSKKKRLCFLVVGATYPMLMSCLGPIRLVPACGFKATCTPLPKWVVLAFLLRHVLVFVLDEVHLLCSFKY